MLSKPTDREMSLPESGPKGTAIAGGVAAKRPIVDSHVLFAGGNELMIFHSGETYQLRQTRLGKLILTK